VETCFGFRLSQSIQRAPKRNATDEACGALETTKFVSSESSGGLINDFT
jgi:hypothetical protein